MRDTQLEVQPAARFEVAVATGPASAPVSPATRSRNQRKRGFTTTEAMV